MKYSGVLYNEKIFICKSAESKEDLYKKLDNYYYQKEDFRVLFEKSKIYSVLRQWRNQQWG